MSKILCDICHEKGATIHFKSVIDGKTMELHLCEGCAVSKGIEFKPTFSFTDFLSTLADLEALPVPKKERKELKCPFCHLSYREFREVGKFGCPNCYEAFSKYIPPLFEKIHGRSTHVTQSPQLVEEKISALKRKLKKCIEKENYEEAAKIRDEIKELEEKSK